MTGVLNFIGERETELAKKHAIVEFKLNQKQERGERIRSTPLTNGGIGSTHPHGDDEP